MMCKFKILCFKTVLVLLAIASLSDAYMSAEEELEKITGQMAHFIRLKDNHNKTGSNLHEITEHLSKFEMPHHLLAGETRKMDKTKLAIKCGLCRSTLDIILTGHRWHFMSINFIKGVILKACVETGQSEEVCKGLIEQNFDTLLYIVDNRNEITGEMICGVFLQFAACEVSDPYLEWSLDIPKKNTPKTKVLIGTKNEEPLNILQITDIHYDPDYVTGGNANCGKPACCRYEKVVRPEDAAGKWGDYRSCDMPWDAIEDLMNRVITKHKKIDYVYFTGDIVNHADWETSQSGNTEVIRKIFSTFKNTFGNITVIPSLGNHESNPINQYSPDAVSSNFKTQWLYDLLAEEWVPKWLPDDTRQTIKDGGYYTMLLRPGFRVIVINSNVCNVFNWWLLYDPKMSVTQLQWLINVLLEAEKNNEKVHILSHIPTGEDTCFKTYAREYRRIIDRFSDTITAQINGHTHRDQFAIYYDRDTGVPNNVAFNGGSATTYFDVNPNYRIYEVETNTYNILNYQTWIYNLTDANLTPDKPPNWFQMYSFKDAYNVESLSPKSLDELVQRMAIDHDLLYKYFEYKVKLGDPFLKRGCDQTCLNGHLCEIVTTEFGDRSICNKYISNNASNIVVSLIYLIICSILILF